MHRICNAELFSCFNPERSIEHSSPIVIDSGTLVNIFRFLNRKIICIVMTVNRRWRDIFRQHFNQYPLLLYAKLRIAEEIVSRFRMKKPAFEVEFCGLDTIRQTSLFHTIRQIPLHSLPMHSSVPAYLRFKTVYIHAPDLFKNSCRILAALKHLQSAFVGCMLVFSSGFYKPFTTRHSFLSFLKLQLLPLFPECEKYKFCGPNMRINDLNEFEQEQLLLLPELCNTLGSIELAFSIAIPYCEEDYSDLLDPIISIPEVITWLHRPNPNDPSKMRVLKLGDECLTRMRKEDTLKKLKHQLCQILATATQSRSYRLEVVFDRSEVEGRETFLNDDFTAINHNTGEQLTIFYREQYDGIGYPIHGIGYPFLFPHQTVPHYPPFVCFQRNNLPSVSM